MSRKERKKKLRTKETNKAKKKNIVLIIRDVRYRRFSMLPTGNNRKSDFDVTYR